jgi:hypothetical protein
VGERLRTPTSGSGGEEMDQKGGPSGEGSRTGVMAGWGGCGTNCLLASKSEQ